MFDLKVNGENVEVDAAEDTPLLWVLRDNLGLIGTRYGCGVGSCGACTVQIDGEARYSCQTLLRDVGRGEITTIEGLSPKGDHPVQQAWIAEQVPQCGYCQSGQIMRAAALLDRNPSPNRQEILDEMSSNLCRCGTYPRIVRAIERASQEG
ncbi:MAG: (2Fe-2S)-binding protein [Pseudomonadota bacterium]